MAEGVALGVAEGVALGVAEGVALGVGVGVATPLFQINFFPDFTQVYFLPKFVARSPTFLQVAPAFGVTAMAETGRRRPAIKRVLTMERFRIPQSNQSLTIGRNCPQSGN